MAYLMVAEGEARMVLAMVASAVGKQVVTHTVRTWLGARRERGRRGAELIELVKIDVPDHFQRRKLVRQLEVWPMRSPSGCSAPAAADHVGRTAGQRA